MSIRPFIWIRWLRDAWPITAVETLLCLVVIGLLACVMSST